MKTPGIYKIQSKLYPDRVYIGSSLDIKQRKIDHFKELRKNTHKNGRLQNHTNKYGIDDLVFIMIEPCLPEFLLIREQYYIDTGNPYFNICLSAKSWLGLKHTEEAKAKISHSKKGKHLSEETRKKISESHKGQIAWNKGKKTCEKTKNLLSERLIGNQRRKGIPASDEIRRKISERLIGNKYALGMRHSEETKAKYHIQRLGNKHTLGYKHNEESKKKMSESHKGFKHSSVTREKMREVKLEYWAKKKIAS